MAGPENDEGATTNKSKRSFVCGYFAQNWHAVLHFARHSHNADTCALEKRSRLQTTEADEGLFDLYMLLLLQL